MKIAKLEKKKRLYLLETDTGESCYITEDTLVRFFLSVGKEITSVQLKEIRTFAQFSYGKNLALYFLSFQARTKKEMQTYLRKYDIEEAQIKRIISDLEADNWINDSRYARNYLENQLHSGDKGPYQLKQKLQQKGIPTPLIEEALEGLDFTPVATKVAQKLERKYRHRLTLRNLQTKIKQSLYQKGFNSSSIQTALKQIEWEKDEDTEAYLLEKELDKALRRYQRKYQGYELKQRLTQALLRKGFDYDRIKTEVHEALNQD